MKKLVRILHVIGAMDRGGAETLIMNLFRKIDRKKYQFDFLVHTERHCDYDDEIVQLGGRIFHIVPYKGYNLLSYKKECRIFFEKHPEIDIVHGHIGSCASIYLREAKRAKRYTIAHSHSINGNSGARDLLYQILTSDNRRIADFFLACSMQAGVDRYGKKVVESDRFQILNNGIDAEKFVYNDQIHKDMKKRLDLENKIVFGHVGRFVKEKNHIFLIKVFAAIAELEERAEFVLVGRGELETDIKEKVNDLSIKKRVHFLGVRDDIPQLMIMMDAFIFPSHCEGLGIAAIEAQAAGLPCILSDKVPKEAIVTKNVVQMDISSDPRVWAETILKMYYERERKNMLSEIRKAHYDIVSSVDDLEKLYCIASKIRR